MMMFLTGLFSILGSVLSGGATGLLGVGLQRFFEFLNAKTNLAKEKQQQDFQLAMRDKDATLMDKEWAGRLRVADREGQAAESVAADNAFSLSLMKEPEHYSNTATVTPNQNWILVILDLIRGLVRPVLTVYLCVLTTLLWLHVTAQLVGTPLNQEQYFQLMLQIVSTILYLTTTCVLWWFGTRNQQKPPRVAKL